MQQDITEDEAKEVFRYILYKVGVARHFHHVSNLPRYIRVQGKIPYNSPIAFQEAKLDINKITGYCQRFTGKDFSFNKKDRITIEVDKALFCEDFENQEYDFSIERVKMVIEAWLASNSIY